MWMPETAGANGSCREVPRYYVHLGGEYYGTDQNVLNTTVRVGDVAKD